MRITEDSALFYYSGYQWIQEGRVPYRHLWDIKPPLTHETMAFIAVLTGGDPAGMHAIGIAINIGSIVGAVLTSMIAVRELTDSRLAGAVTGISFLAFPYLLKWAVTGFRPKYPFAFALGLMVLAGVREQWTVAASSSAIAAGFWQPGASLVIITVLTLMWLEHQGRVIRPTVNKAGFAIAAIGLIAVLPLAIGGAVPEVFIQAVIGPFVTRDTGVEIEYLFRSTQPYLLAIGLVGSIGIGIVGDHQARWWPALILISLIIVALKGDLDGSPDLIPLSIAIAIGVGLSVGIANSPNSLFSWGSPQLWIVLVIGISIWLVPPPDFGSVHSGGPVYDLFREGTIQNKCHVRLSNPEKQLMNAVGGSIDDTSCWRPDWWVRL